MSFQCDQVFESARGHDATPRLLLATALLLAGCSGGEGGGGIGLADGQDTDPVVVDFPIAYVKRTLPVDEDGLPVEDDAREQITFTAGADLFLRDRASPSALERNLTFSVTEGLGDVRDVDSSFDGSKLVFAMRMPLLEDVDDEDQPTWNIWQYDLETDELRRIIASEIAAEAGHDIMPTYLPDGRIVFTSTRQRQSSAILLDEGKPQYPALDEDRNEPAFLLHVMSEDGSEIRQISFNQSHDLYPSILDTGEIMFSRWDHAGNNNAISLYRMRPDGSALELLYGVNSHDTGTEGDTVQFLKARQMPDGSVMSIIRPFETSNYGGNIVLIDSANYVEFAQPTLSGGAPGGPAQKVATANPVRTDEGPSPGGRYSGAFPLRDGTERLLVSWSDCRLLEAADPADPLAEDTIVPCTEERLADPTAEPGPPLYGIWIYDMTTDTQLPVALPEEGVMFTEVVAAEPRALPPVLLDGVGGIDLDLDLLEEGAGIIHIRSVYDVDGVDTAVPNISTLADPAQTTAAGRPARFLRIMKPVSMPDDDIRDIPGTAFGRDRRQGMREILGYVPVQPDGSVKVKVPANVALAISILDADGRRISPRHYNWLQLRPGQVLECNGCHEPGAGISHGRSDAFGTINAGATTTSLPFPNTDPALFADFGETMAEALTRNSCATDDCAALEPGFDLVYEDIWTDEAAAGRPRDVGFAYLYDDLTTPRPTTESCIRDWASGCRVVINYEEHIHALWGTPRITLDADGMTVLEDLTCNTCHGIVDDLGQARVPDAQLDLSDGLSNDEPDHFKSYRELLFGDNEQEVVMDVLQDVLVEVGIDPETGDPILQTVPVGPSMSAAGARASSGFFSRFAPGGSHAGYLSEAELKLISEWLDVGGQYYNDPFAAPEN